MYDLLKYPFFCTSGSIGMPGSRRERSGKYLFLTVYGKAGFRLIKYVNYL